jgi:hypothetical protein
MSSLTLKYLDLLDRRVITVDETIRLLKNKPASASPDISIPEERFTCNSFLQLREKNYEILNAF